MMIKASKKSPPAFSWEDWYAGVGGRNNSLPEVTDYLHKIYHEQFPRFHGTVAENKKVFASPKAASLHLKEKAKEFGADLVGICEIEPSDLYKGRSIDEKYAIAIGGRMRYRAFQKVPSKEAAIECMRIYHHLGEVIIKFAEYIRSLGYSCEIEHPIGDSNLLHIPIALKAGFGELGRHGSIINPELGPLFRLGSVATSIPMQIDYPIDAGIAAFCDKCKACRIYCPADAVPDERSKTAGKDHLGNDKYKIDTGKCFPYFRDHYYCSACLPVCVYNHKVWAKDFEGFDTIKFPKVDMQLPPLPYDGVDEDKKHEYPRYKREEKE